MVTKSISVNCQCSKSRSGTVTDPANASGGSGADGEGDDRVSEGMARLLWLLTDPIGAPGYGLVDASTPAMRRLKR